MTKQVESKMSYLGSDFCSDFEMNLAEIDIIESEHHDGTMETLFDRMDRFANSPDSELDEDIVEVSATFVDLVDWTIARYLIEKGLIDPENPYKHMQGETDVNVQEEDGHFVIASRTKPNFGDNLSFKVFADLKRSDYNDEARMQAMIDHICEQVDEQLVEQIIN